MVETFSGDHYAIVNDVIIILCSDLVSYDVESDEVEVLCDGTSSQSKKCPVV